MEDLFTELKGATMFSSIDLNNAYLQVMRHEDSRDLMAFITHEGLFRFRRVRYGLASGLAAFQKMMVTILKGLHGVQNYLDDVIVYGHTAAEHDRNLQAVLTTLQHAGLILNRSKCKFSCTSLPYLGHNITAQSLLPNDCHIQAILQAPAPTDTAKLCSFLGLTSWCSRFVPNYSSEVELMRACLKNVGVFSWTEATQKSFEKVKGLIVNSPALAIFDPALHTLVTCDASDYRIGAVLTQIHADSSERTVAFCGADSSHFGRTIWR